MGQRGIWGYKMEGTGYQATLKITGEQNKLIDYVVDCATTSDNENKFKDKSHFIRVAIIQLLKKELKELKNVRN